MGRNRRFTSVALVVVLLALINLPALQATYLGWKLDRQGIPTTAEVVGADEVTPGRFWLTIVVPPSLDPDRFATPARVSESAYEEAIRTRQIGATVLEDRPSFRRVEGQIVGRTGLWITLGADAALALLIGWLWRSGRRPHLREPLRLEAIVDPVTTHDREPLVRENADVVDVVGRVDRADDQELLLTAGEESVIVIVAGRDGDARVGDWVEVTGRVLAP